MHCPLPRTVDQRYTVWKARLSKIDGGKEIVKLTGEISTDLKLLERGDLILATLTQWDVAMTEERTNGRAIHSR